jgi:surface protein
VFQSTTDSALLYQHAAQIQPAYQLFIREVAAAVPGVFVTLPSLKHMERIVEKTILKRRDDPGNANKVYDVVRSMITCDSMGQIATIVASFQQHQDIVSVTRIKDRFFDDISAGGWRDCLINFCFASDKNRHVCEVQIVHNQMMTARKGLPGHAVYNRVRNASELLLFMDIHEQPNNTKELRDWLIEYHAGKDEKNPDKFTHGHPNLWDVSLVTDMGELFDCRELRNFNHDISGWDVSKVRNMKRMFYAAQHFDKLEQLKWNNVKYDENIMGKRHEEKTRMDLENKETWMFALANTNTSQYAEYYLERIKALEDQMVANAKGFAAQLADMKRKLMEAEMGGSDDDGSDSD